MTAVRPGLIALALLAASAPVAAALQLQAYDLRKCVRWDMEPDTGGERSSAWRAARQKARAPLQVFSATAELPEGGTLRKFGACSLRPEGRKRRLRCAPGLDFPLSGASYLTADTQKFRSVAVFSCTSGCDQKIPEAVYELRAQQPDEAVQEKEEHRRSTPFRRACAGLR